MSETNLTRRTVLGGIATSALSLTGCVQPTKVQADISGTVFTEITHMGSAWFTVAVEPDAQVALVRTVKSNGQERDEKQLGAGVSRVEIRGVIHNEFRVLAVDDAEEVIDSVTCLVPNNGGAL